MNDTTNEANAKADKRSNDEQQEQRLTADARDEGSYPGYCLSHYRGYIPKYCSHELNPSPLTDE